MCKKLSNGIKHAYKNKWIYIHGEVVFYHAKNGLHKNEFAVLQFA